ncbi:MAG: ATP-binding protein [bacterium]|nr:ATP-binding protein [bacterium]
MTKFFSKRRLKIAEQIILVSFFAVFIPMVISGLIINNVNQHSNREQLKDAAVMIANIVSEELDVFQSSINNELSQIESTLVYYNSPQKENDYLDTIMTKFSFYKELSIVPEYGLSKFKKYNLDNDSIVYKKQLKDGRYLVAVLDVKNLRKNVFRTISNDKRQVYVIRNSDKQLVGAVNYEENVFKQSLAQLPQDPKIDTTTVFGKIKNQPLVYKYKTNPDVTIIVNTTEAITKNTIDYNRNKIILSILISTLAVYFFVGLYTSYLYTNIRQLFKAIIAISKGNYERRIRLLTNVFTPFEIVFLGTEFNRMVSQIHKSHIQLKKKNKELKEMDEFRSNMIDTVSHEFRTPLTSIQGYTSRLLRQDIEIDEETKQKSLKTIKRQAERLKRMIEDILVIPDIEGAHINFDIKPVEISSVIENSVTLVKNDSGKEIVNNIQSCDAVILADNDRIEQVFVNLIENAIKYSKENSPITLDYEVLENQLVVSVKNDYDVIPREKLKTLFEKFTRIDDSTTRTTRGTGLGLYIVKGLVEAMGGEIRLYSNKECGFCVKVYMPLTVKDEAYI